MISGYQEGKFWNAQKLAVSVGIVTVKLMLRTYWKMHIITVKCND